MFPIGPQPYPAPFDFLSNVGCLGEWQLIEFAPNQFRSEIIPLCSGSLQGEEITDGEGNVLSIAPWWFKTVAPNNVLSFNAWALEKAKQMHGAPNPNNYEWIILGEYALNPGGFINSVHDRRKFIFDLLRQAGSAAGMPSNYNWTDALAYGAKAHWDQSGQPLRWLETPAVYPVHMALVYASNEYPQLAPFVEQTGPGSKLWIDTQNAAWARRDAHDDVTKSLAVMFVASVLSFGAAAYFAPAVSATSTTVAAGTTSTVSGAELAALVEAGTVGAEGAFLEAAALSGSTVTYSTATGAVLSAVTPAGAVVGFDPSIDAFVQFGIEPAQVAEAVQLPEPVEVAQPEVVQSELVDSTNYAEKLKETITKTAESQIKSTLAMELRKLFYGAPDESAQLAPGQGVAPTGGMGDSTVVVALGIVAGAFALRKLRNKRL